MYTTVRGLPSDETVATADPVVRRRVSRIVITLGMVSFFTDLSSEMVVAVLPVYLTLVLGLSPIQYGLIDGLYQGVTAAVRIVGGIAADLTRRPKIVAVLGYGLSCVCKLFFLPAHSFASITGLVALDRTGKGLRTAPRDAMIVDSAEPHSLGYSFGVHRAMDTAGALGGPLIAFGILAWLVDGYDVIFVMSFSLAAIGVAVLVLFVPGRRPDPPVEAAAAGLEEPSATGGTDAPGVTRKGALGRTVREFGSLAKGSAYRRLLGVAGLLSLTTISDGFVYLTLKDRVGIGAALFPLLFVGTAAAYLGLAIPLGRLADRVGRVRVFLGGHLIAAVGYLSLWLLPAGPALVVGVLALVGTYYAATDGVLPALTAPLVPRGVRTSGIAGVQTVMAVGSMASAALFGVVWSQFGQRTAVAVFAVGLIAAVMLATRLLADLSTGSRTSDR
jgi:MFS family permease